MAIGDKFNIYYKDEKFYIENSSGDIIIMERYTGKFDSSNSNKSLESFFRGYHLTHPPFYLTNYRYIGEYVVPKFEGDSKSITEFHKFLKDVRELSKLGLHYRDKRYTFPSIYRDFVVRLNNLSKEFDLRRLHEELKNYEDLGSQLHIAHLSIHDALDIFERKFKLRKDIFRIVRDRKIAVNVEFLKNYYIDEEYLNELILKFEELNYWEDFKELIADRRYYFSSRGIDNREDFINLRRILDTKFRELVRVYGYNIRSVLDQYINYYGIYENFDWQNYLQYLLDYAHMLKLMKVEKFRKFPKYLKSMHDIVTREFNLYKQEFDEEIFYNNINHTLEMKTKDFIIVTPKKPTDLKFEGKKLSHCVGSYIDRVIKNQTQICFLRKKAGEPLVTIEIKNNRIVQAKGLANRSINKLEKNFISYFAKEKNLEVKL